jgi:hypothetical protein
MMLILGTMTTEGFFKTPADKSDEEINTPGIFKFVVKGRKRKSSSRY